ncbi:hypothetical protein D4R75_04630 [bacterium]|nr:MAG: hypothetical protein D4R75_04630 [bacterium]
MAPVGAPVHVQVLNMLGEEISSTTLFGNGSTPQFHWEGTNAIGRAVESGFYLAVFRSSILTQTQKLLYLK